MGVETAAVGVGAAAVEVEAAAMEVGAARRQQWGVRQTNGVNGSNRTITIQESSVIERELQFNKLVLGKTVHRTFHSYSSSSNIRAAH